MSRAHDLREGGSWTPRQRRKNDLIHAAIVAALAVVRRLPRVVTAALCRALATLAYLALVRERRLVRARLAAGVGAPVAERHVRAAFFAAGDTLADTLHLLDPRERAARTMTLDPTGRDVFRAALAEQRGVVYVTAHLGSWERMAALLVEEGFPVATVARESYDPRLTALYERLRAPRGVRSIYRGRPGAASAILRELRAGGAVGFLLDLPMRVPSVPALLFGAEAAIPVGAARIALRLRPALVIGTPGPAPFKDGRRERAGVRTLVSIERVSYADLVEGRDGERALVTRLAHLLGLRIAEQPSAWLGLFASSNNREASGGPHRQLRYLNDSR